MSEKAFRLVLVTVIAIWIVFVLVPAAVDFAPRAWSMVQYFLPGNSPKVQVVVKDTSGTAVADARVTIVVDQSALVAFTNTDGVAMFDAVPAGPGRKIKAQKLDYDIAILDSVTLPQRQRARYSLTLIYSPYRRLYIGHELATPVGDVPNIVITSLDQASRLPLTPPGSYDTWENIPALDMQIQRNTQRLYVLAPDRVIEFDLSDGRSRQLSLSPLRAGGMALSPRGDGLYLYTLGRDGNSHWLTMIETQTWVTRYSAQVPSNAERAIIVPSNDERRIYVAGVNDRTISVFDARQSRRTGIYRTSGAVRDMALSRDGRTLYILLDQTPWLLSLDLLNNDRMSPVLNNVQAGVLEGATKMAYTEQYMSRWLCLLKPEHNQIVLVEANTQMVYPVDVGKSPSALVPIPGDEQVYVANRDDNTLSVVSLTNHRVTDTVDVRSRPVMIAVP